MQEGPWTKYAQLRANGSETPAALEGPWTKYAKASTSAVDPNDASKLYIATHYGLFLLEDEQNLYQVGNTRDDYMGFSPHPTDSSVFFSKMPKRGERAR